MLTSPHVDLISQPDPPHLQVSNRVREVRAPRQPVNLLPADTEHIRDLGRTREP
jgi:hypothetical protein